MQAGLIAGAAVAMPGTRIVGIDTDAEPTRGGGQRELR